MICRKWKTWTDRGNAAKYADALRSSVIPDLTEGNTGFEGFNVLMLDQGEEMEITLLMWFDSIEAVKKFAGDDHSKAVTPPDSVQPFLLRYNETVEHHTVLI